MMGGHPVDALSFFCGFSCCMDHFAGSDHTVISRGKFQSRRSISHEFVVHIDFRIFGIGRYRNRAESVRWLARKSPRSLTRPNG